MKVSIIGTGYVGLTTGISLAYIGHHVTCMDVDVNKIQNLQMEILPIYEPGLENLLTDARSRITFTTSFQEAVMEAEIIFLAVGTPPKQNGAPNLEYLFAALEDMIPLFHSKLKHTLLVNKSTVPVGTTDQISTQLRDEGLTSTVTVASNPEFLRQGHAVHDTLYPYRIVIGGNEKAAALLTELYKDIIQQTFIPPNSALRPEECTHVPFIQVDRRSAELSKYAANAFLAMKISYINEIANVCDRVGANITHISQIIGMDKRIGTSFLQAGIGYGGSCFPKDTRALHYLADRNGYDFKLLSAVIEVNQSQKYVVIHKAREALGSLSGKKIAILGLTFKPGTDDLRESPSIDIIQTLLNEGAIVYAHDPVAIEKARLLLPFSVHLNTEIKEVLYQAEAAILITEWPEYENLDSELVKSWMLHPLFIDGRNALKDHSRGELDYKGIGIGGRTHANIGK